MNRRTTISAVDSDLATLEAEAVRRGVSATTVIAEAVAEKAAALRRARQPRLGVADSGGRSAGAGKLTSEPIAHPPR
ncbi:MAG: hypothetical protein JOZ46_09925 [Candidatus Dormibacteraeota bacterium]|nr:hypothetical protein [Candidatus Dormibacteraeota bacterium]MBV9526115.1 hypothetical protein [Candidatus Dormibacteraeota bacterium]